ncbi:MAG: hypothetical protein ACRDP8_16415 [Actinopolymorphaceae bacterium]
MTTGIGYRLLLVAQDQFPEPFLTYGPIAWVELGRRLGKGLLVATPLRLIYVSEATFDPIAMPHAETVGVHLKTGLLGATLTVAVEAGPPLISLYGRKALVHGTWAFLDETLKQRR